MPTIIQTVPGRVSGMWGTATRLGANGKMQALKLGDEVNKGDVILTSQDGIVRISPEGSDLFPIATARPATDELDRVISALDDPSAQDAPAAGIGAGDAGDLSPGLRVDRISESIAAPGGLAPSTGSSALQLDPRTGGVAATNETLNPVLIGADSNTISATEEGAAVSLGLIAPTGTSNTPLITVTQTPLIGQLQKADGSPVLTGSVLTITELTGLKYLPPADYNGTAAVGEFSYTVTDRGVTASGGVAISLGAVNDAPVGNPDSASTLEDTPVAGNVLTNDSDVDGGSLRITQYTVGGVAHAAGSSTLMPGVGSLLLNGDGSFTFTPAADYHGAVPLITYTVSDGAATMTSTLTINVAPVNDAPTAVNDVTSTPINVPVTVPVLANDFDRDGDPLTVTSAALTDPSRGNVVVNADGSLGFTPAPNTTGPVTITYTVTDGQGGSGSASVVVNVGSNTPPTGSNAAFTIAEDTSKTFSATDFGYADADLGQSFAAVRIDTLPVAGSLTLGGVAVSAGQLIAAASLGNLVFTPVANANGAGYASFTFSVQDSAGAFDVAPNTISLNVTPVADPAVIGGLATGATVEDTTLSATGTLSVSDPDAGEAAFVVQAAAAGTHGTFSINAAGVWTYSLNNADPAVQALGAGQTLPAETFTVTTIDGTAQVITVSITGTDDAPVISVGTGSVVENTQPSIGGTLTATDADNSALAFTAGTTSGAYGSLVLAANGVWAYTLDARAEALAGGQLVSDPLTVTLSDGSTTTVTLSITGTNDAAAITGTSIGSVTEDGVVSAVGTLAATDIDSPTTFVAAGSAGTFGDFAITAAGSWTYVLRNADANVQALTSAQHPTESFVVSTADGTTQTITVTVNGANEAPVGVISPASGLEDAAGIPITLSATDVDGSIASFTVTALPANGVLLFGGVPVLVGSVIPATAGSAALSFVPNADWNGSTSLVFSAADNEGTASPAVTQGITVQAVNDAPVAAADSAGTAINVPLNNIDVLVNDTDVDGDPLTVTGASVAAALGTVSVNANGSLNFTPATNVTGPVSISYTLSDGQGGTSTGTLTVTVGTNTPPTGANATFTIDEDTSRTFAAADFGFSDADLGQSFAAVRIDTLPAAGSLTLGGVAVSAGQLIAAASLGNLVFTPVANANGIGYASFTFSVQDSAGAFDVAPNTVSLNVTPVADPAVIGGLATGATVEDTTLSATGTLTVSDPDAGEAAFVAQAAAAGAHGTFSVSAAGVWTYTLNNADPAVQALGAGQTLPNETFSVATIDGTTRVVSISITGTNDAAVLGSATVNLTETNAVLATGGTLTISDIDGPASFVPQVATVGSYGTFAINAAGVWTYTASSAHNEFVVGTTYVETFNVAAADGTPTAVTVRILGTNDAPVASAVSASGFEDPAARIVVTLAGTDVDGSIASYRITTLLANGSLFAAATGGSALSAGAVVTGPVYFVPTANSNGSTSFQYTATDNNGAVSPAATATIVVAPVNDAPTLTGLGPTLNYVEANSATVTRTLIDTNVVLSDIDSPNFDGGSLRVAINNVVANQDLLDVRSQGNAAGQIGVSGSNVSYGGVLIGTVSGGTAGAPLVISLNSSATVAAVDALIQNIRYGNQAQLPDTTPRSVSFTVVDGDGTANGGTDTRVVTTTINVASRNDAPSFAGLGGTVAHTENGPATVLDSNATLTDPELGLGAIGGLNNMGGATLTLVRNGGASAQDQFVGTGSLALSGGNVVLGGVNVGSYNSALLATGQLAITFAAGTTNAQANSVLQRIGYQNSSDTPPPNVRIDFTVSDGNTGAQGTGGARSSAVSFVTVNITPFNDAPIANPDTATAVEAGGVANGTTGTNPSGTVLANDSDPEATALTVSAVTGVAAGTVGGNTTGQYGTLVLLANGSYTYTLNNALGAVQALSPGQTLTDTFNYTARDLGLATANSTLTVTIQGRNDAAVVSTAVVTLTETNAVLSTGGTLTISDVDNPATFVAQTNVAGSGGYGRFTLGSNGVWSYTANTAHDEFVAGTTYTDSLTVTSADGTTSTITVNIVGTNDAPVISSATGAIVEDAAPISGTLTATDVDNPALAFVASSQAGAYGALTLTTAGLWTYTLGTASQALTGGQVVVENFTVALNDGSTTTVVVTVTGTDDAPVISTATGAITEDAAPISGTLTATDVDNPALAFVASSQAGAYGALTLTTAGLWTYTLGAASQALAGGQVVVENFTVSLNDGSTTTVAVTVTGTDDAPVISAATGAITEDAAPISGTLTATDVDNPALAFVASSQAGAYGALTLTTAGLWTYTLGAASQALAGGQVVVENFTVSLNDGSTSTVAVTVTGTDDAPVISAATGAITEDAAPISGTLTATDVDNPALAFVAATQAGAYGALTLTTAGLWTYTLGAASQALTGGQVVVENFTVALNDGSTTTVAVTVTGTDDAPVISVGTGSVVENTQPSIGGTLTATDADNSALAFTAGTTSGAYGSLVLAANGVWAYTLDARAEALAGGQLVSDPITVTLNDGSTTTVTLSITGTNDAAAITGTSVGSVTEDGVVSAAGTLAATDIDSPTTFVAAGSAGTFGDFAITAAGSWTYVLRNADANVQALTSAQHPTESFAVSTADGTTQTITVTVNGANEAPVGVVSPASGLEDAAGIPITLSATDVDGSIASFTVTALPANGVLLFGGVPVLVGTVIPATAGSAALSFVPNADWNGSTSLVFSAADNEGTASPAVTQGITVQAVNDAPVAPSVVVNATEEGPDVALTLSSPPFDIDSPSITIRVAQLPTLGSVLLVAGGIETPLFAGQSLAAADFANLVYRPPQDYTAGDPVGALVYDVSDGEFTRSGTITINLAPVDDAPRANAGSASGNEDASFGSASNPALAVALGGSDVDNAISAVTVTQLPANGTLLLADGITLVAANSALTPAQAAALIFVPNPDYFGTATLQFNVTADNGVVSAAATYSLVVVPVNDAPVVASVVVSAVEQGPAVSLGLTAPTDVDDTSLVITVTGLPDPAVGTLLINAADPTSAPQIGQILTAAQLQSLVYVPPADYYNGGNPLPPAGSFTYAVTDNQVVVNGSAVINLSPVNDAPVAENVNAPLPAAPTAPVLIELRGSDVDGTVASFRIGSLPPAVTGSLQMLDGTPVTVGQLIAGPGPVQLRFVPATGFDDATSFNYRVVDNDGAISPRASARIDYSGQTGTGGPNDLVIVGNEDTDLPLANLPNGEPGDVVTVTDLPDHGSLTYPDGSPVQVGDTLTPDQVATLTYRPNPDYSGNDNIGFTLDPADGPPEPGTVTVVVRPVPDAPIAVDDSVDPTAAIKPVEDAPYTFAVASNDYDVDSGETPLLRVTAVEGVAITVGGPAVDITGPLGPFGTLRGSVTLAADGTLSFSPAPDYNGPVSFNYTITDPTGLSDVGTVTFTVDPVNDAPVTVPDSVVTNEDTPITFNPAANDQDVDLTGLSVTALGAPAHGTVALNADGSVTYTPAGNYNGPDSFSYTVTDFEGGVTTGTVSVNVLPVNDPPTSSNQTLTIDEDTPLNGTLPAATDPDGDPVSYLANASAPPANGSVTINADGSYLYTPNPNYFGPDSFGFTVVDSNGLSNSYTVNLTVQPINDAPVTVNTTLIVSEEDPVVLLGAGVTDADPGDSLTITVTGLPTSGLGEVQLGGVAVTVGQQLTTAQLGQLSYLAPLDYDGLTPAGAFTYVASDGLLSTPGQIVIDLRPLNDAPVNTVPVAQTVAEDQPLVFSAANGNAISVADVDALGANLSVTLTSANGNLTLGSTGGVSVSGDGSGSVTLTGTLTAINAALDGTRFQGTAGFGGATSITVSTADNGNTGSGGVRTDVDTIGVTVTPVNDAPAGTDNTITLVEDSAYTLSAADFGFSDLGDSPANAFASVSVAPSGAGTLTLNGVAISAATSVTAAQLAAGQLVFTPALNASGSAYASVSFQVRDDGGGSDTDLSPNTLSFNVTSINDTPVNAVPATLSALEDTLTAITGVSVTDADEASGPATNQLATVQLSVSNGTLQIVLAGTASVSAGSIGSGGLTLSGSQADINATLASLQYQGNANYVGGDTLVVISRDGLGLTDSDTVAITVAPVNDAPSGQDATRTLLEDGSYTFNRGDFGFTDAAGEGNNFVSVTVTPPSAGVLSLAGVPVTAATTVLVAQLDSGALVFTPAANANGNGYANLGFAVHDDGGTANGGIDTDASPNTITFDVTALNDTPVAVADSASLNENATVFGMALTNVLSNDTDADAGDTKAVTAVSFGGTPGALNGVTLGTYGALLLYADGSYQYTASRPAADALALNQTVTESFTYTMSDAAGAVSSTTLTFTITGTDDAPVVSLGSGSVIENTQPSIGGTLSATDLDNPGLAFTAGTVGGAYGSLVLAANGAWTYTLDARAESLGGGQLVSDPITVTLSDGSTTTVTVNITGTNDAAVISSATVGLTETNAVLSTGGTLTVSDIDSPASFVAQVATAGTYGSFTIDAAGVWTYTASSAHDEFAAGATYTDTFTVASADGTTSSVTVNITGTNDAAVLSAATVALTETNAVLSTGGTLTVSDVDSPATFVAQAATAGTYGTFAINAVGVWTYTASSAHDEFAAGTTYTDAFTVASPDGTTSTVTVNIAGTNDAAVLSSATVALTETDAVLSTGGTLTVADVDNPATFAAQAATAGAYGTFAIDTTGVWTYTASSAHDEFVAGTTYSETFVVTSADGTASTVTVNITGTNDAPTITGAQSGSVTEDSTLTSTGTLVVTDPEPGQSSFVAQAATAGTYGSFAITAAGEWTYTLANAAANVQALGATSALFDAFTVTTIDGTTRGVVITINGTNDAPVAVADSAVAIEDTALNVSAAAGVLANDSDVDSGSTLSVASFTWGGTTYAAGASATLSGVGTLQLNGDGSYAFTPAANRAGAVPSVSYAVSDGITSTNSTLSLSITAVADAPVLTLNGTTITGGSTTTTLPAATGLAMAYYDDIAGVSSANAGTISVVEAAVEASTATSTSIASDVAVASVGVDDAYRYTGYIYLTAGQAYAMSGTRDDTLMVKIGGTSVYSVGYNNWGAFTASTFTPTASGYYSIEVIAYNGDGVGDLDLGLSVNGAAALDLSTANFQLYASASTLTGSGTVVGGFVTNSDGGYFGTTIKGNEDSAIALGNIAASLADTDGSETLAVSISAIPVGATLTDGTNSFTATAGATSAVVTGWNLNAIMLTPTPNASGTINLTVTATATDTTGAAANSIGTLAITVTPVADTPGLVISNTLVALAQGSTGVSTISFPILSTLVDTDGSESLAFIVSGAPTAASFNHGTNLGGGSWSFVAADLSDLTLTLPAGYTTTGTTLTVTSTSTESGNGTSAGTSATLTLISDYTTTTYTGTGGANTNSGTGNNNDYMNGAGGNDTLSGNNGNDLIYGGTGNDNINGGSGSDALFGEAGTDTIVGGAGSDRIRGGTGNDTLTGGTGAGTDATVDVFTWSLADAGSAGTPVIDTITDFNAAAASSGGDVLDLRDLLSGDVLGAGNSVGNLANYLDFDTTTTAGSTIVHISSSGGFTNGTYTAGAEDERIVLSGVDLRTGMGLVSTATDTQIIQELLTRGKLITDSP